jgi:Flp pilus assembly protein TadG
MPSLGGLSALHLIEGIMRHKQKIVIKSPRNRQRSGTGMLEMAFLLMPTFALIGGFVDIGMALFTWNTLQNAVREGARYAITYQVDSSGHQITSIKNQTAAWAMGMVSATATSTSGANVPYVDVNFYSQPTQANPNGALLPASGTANSPGNIVEVAIKNYPYALMAPFSGALSATTATAFYATPGSSLRIQVYSTDVLGGTPSTGTPAL